jgi:hypothetical protein
VPRLAHRRVPFFFRARIRPDRLGGFLKVSNAPPSWAWWRGRVVSVIRTEAGHSARRFSSPLGISKVDLQLRIQEFSQEEARQDWTLTMPGTVADMLLDAWAAATGQPAFVTSTVSDITGNPARRFEEWVEHNSSDFRPDIARLGRSRLPAKGGA